MDRTSNARSIVVLGLIFITCLIGYGFIMVYIIHGEEKLYEANFGDFSVAIGTILLAGFTVYLAWIEIDEGKKERRRLRLKEQLEEFYSPLMAHIEFFDKLDEHRVRDTAIWKLMVPMRNRYEFLASPDLREKLRTYYNTNLSSLTETKWNELIKPIKKMIVSDFHSLIDEYNELTKK